MGVKIPKPGYLDPHPLSFSADVTWFHRFGQFHHKYRLQIQLKKNQQNINSSNFHHEEKISNFYETTFLSWMFVVLYYHILLEEKMGVKIPTGVFTPGGEDTLAGVSWPPGVKLPRVGVKIPREILTPGGQATRGYLDPRGSSCPGVKINWYTGTAFKIQVKFTLFLHFLLLKRYQQDFLVLSCWVKRFSINGKWLILILNQTEKLTAFRKLPLFLHSKVAQDWIISQKAIIHFNISCWCKYMYSHVLSIREAPWPSGWASDSLARGRGFDSHSCHLVVSLSKMHLPPKKVLVIPR